MGKKLTVKETKLVKGIAVGKTKQAAALEAGYGNGTNAASASVQASDALNKPKVQEALHAALEKAGITPDLAIAPIGQALRDDDLDMRLKGSDRALKLMMPKENPNININFNQIAQRDKDEYFPVR